MRSSSKHSQQTNQYKYMLCFRYGSGKSIEIDIDKNDILKMVESRYLDLQLDKNGYTRFYITDGSMECLTAALKAVAIKKMVIVMSPLLAVHESYRNQAILEEDKRRVLAIQLTPEQASEAKAYCMARARMSAYFIRVDAASSTIVFDLALLEKCKTKDVEEFTQAVNDLCQKPVVTACIINVDKPKGPSAISSLLSALYPGRVEVVNVASVKEQKVIPSQETPPQEKELPSYPVHPQKTAMSLTFFPNPEIYNEMPALEATPHKILGSRLGG